MGGQVEKKLASVRQGNDAELEHSGHAAQQRLAKAVAALLVRSRLQSAPVATSQQATATGRKLTEHEAVQAASGLRA